MPLSSAKRAWIAVAALALVAAAGIGLYLRYAERRTSTATSNAGPATYPASPQQTRRVLGVLDELPGDAPAVAYIDVESLRKVQSSLAALLGLSGGNAAQDHDYQQFVHETGFDYTRDLDRAAIAFWFDTLGEGVQDSLADNRAFVVADGRFDQGRIRAYALKSGKAQARGTQTIYEVPGKPSVSFEFLSPSRIAITSGSRSTKLLVNARPTTRDPAFQSRLDRVAGAPLFALVRMDRLPDSLYAGFHNSPQIENLARSLRSLTLAAQPQGDMLKVALDGESTSVRNALMIATLLEISRMGASMALSDSKTRSQLTSEQAAFLDALLQKARISHQDRWVRMALDVTPAMLGSAEAPHAQGDPVK
ncbi:MAG: hypothetical protein ABSA57_07650 [Candidatus Acidiferrales bacterium]